MSTEENDKPLCSERCCTVSSYAAAVLGAIFIVWGLNWMMRHYTEKVETETRAARSIERKAARVEIEKNILSVVDSYGWENQPKGIVRLPVERGMELIIAEYRDSATARKNLTDRLAKATAKPPEKPSEFE